MTDELIEYHPMFEAIERRVTGEVETGSTWRVRVTVVISVAAVALFFSHTGRATGWSIYLYTDAARAEAVGPLSMLFVHASAVLCVVGSVAALIARRFPIICAAAAGCAITAILGMWAIWSRQTLPAGSGLSGPGLGTVIGALAALVLAGHWIGGACATAGIQRRACVT